MSLFCFHISNFVINAIYVDIKEIIVDFKNSELDRCFTCMLYVILS